MSDRLFYSLAALGSVAMIALASVFPQGVGARSPGPFGHETVAARAAKAGLRVKATKTGSKIQLRPEF